MELQLARNKSIVFFDVTARPSHYNPGSPDGNYIKIGQRQEGNYVLTKVVLQACNAKQSTLPKKLLYPDPAISYQESLHEHTC